MRKYIFILLFISSSSLYSQSILTYYGSLSGKFSKKITKDFLSNEYPYTLFFAKDTLVFPINNKVLVFDSKGNFTQMFPYDTAAYFDSKRLLVGHDFGNGDFLFGLVSPNGALVMPMQYRAILKGTSSYALQDTSCQWSLHSLSNKKLSSTFYESITYTSFGDVIVKDSSGFGLLNQQGITLVSPSFKSVLQQSASELLVTDYDYWEVRASSGEVLKKLYAEGISFLKDSFLVYTIGQRKLIYTTVGKLIGSSQGYTKVEVLGSTYFKVSQQDDYGVLDLSGNIILPCQFKEIALDTTSGFIKALGYEVVVLRYSNVTNKLKSRWMLYDSLGNALLSKSYRTIEGLIEGRAAVQGENFRWGFVTSKGDVSVPILYESVHPFKSGKALVKLPASKEEGYRLIDSFGNVLKRGREAQLIYYGVIFVQPCDTSQSRGDEPLEELVCGVPPYRYDSYSKTDYGYFRIKNGRYTGILSPLGKEIVYAYQDTVYRASSDTFFLYKRKDGRVGFTDKHGNTCLDLTDEFEDVEPIREGYARFKSDGLYGFMDVYGNTYIAPKYEKCRNFSDGMAAVYLKNKWGFVDKDENLLVQPYYKEVRDFENGFAAVKNNAGKWIFIDKSGKQLNSFAYENYWKITSNEYVVVKNNKQGITTSGGREVLAPKYEKVDRIGTDLIKVKKDGHYGVMDDQENIIYYYQYSDLFYDPVGKLFYLKISGEERLANVSKP